MTLQEIFIIAVLAVIVVVGSIFIIDMFLTISKDKGLDAKEKERRRN